MKSLYERLTKYATSNYIPMHMPGHKRQCIRKDSVIPYHIDITEISGFDNMNAAEGILLEGMEKARLLYGSDKSYYLINGSTCGILAAIHACTNYGDKIILSRNSHKAVYHGMELNGLEGVYLYPNILEEFDINTSVSLEVVEKILIRNQDAKLIIITSPTYEGIVSDIEGICKIAHTYKIPVLVDEAHGAHLGFHPKLLRNSIDCGADIVIHSLHKTLPALTQCGLAHVNSSIVNQSKFEKALSIFQTSSPSYLLMASIDECISYVEEHKQSIFHTYTEILDDFYRKTKKLRYIKILANYINEENSTIKNSIFNYDRGKIIIGCKKLSITGIELMSILREEYKIELEMASTNYAIAMTSIIDKKNNLDRLYNALLSMDETLGNKIKKESHPVLVTKIPTRAIPTIHTISKTLEMEGESTEFNNLSGRISAEYVWAYPPGIPFILPGELITEETIGYFQYLQDNNVKLHSTNGKFPNKLYTFPFNEN